MILLYFSIYSYFETDRYYVDGIVSTGSGEFNFTRAQTVNGVLSSNDELILSRVNETIVADTDSQLFRFSIASGIKRQVGAFSFSPFGRIAFAKVEVDRYREQLDIANSPEHPATDAGGGFALRVSEQVVESVTTGVGVNAGYVKSTSKAVITLQSDIEWIHELNARVSSLNSALAGFSEGTIYSLALSQQFPDRKLDADYFYAGLGSSVIFPNGIQIYAAAQFLVGYQDVDEKSFIAGVRFEY